MVNVWCIHNDVLSDELIKGGFVSVGWDKLGDLRAIGTTREELKAALANSYPDDKPRAIAGWAGNLLRFSVEITVGDVIVAPYRPDSTINLGVVTDDYRFDDAAPTHRHRRSVRWEKLGVNRTVFSQPALYEIGSLLTVFGVRKHPQEFLAVLKTDDEAEFEISAHAAAVASPAPEVIEIDEPRASRIERHTRDFILDRLKDELTPREFEEFVADLLRAMGYEARLTQFSGDGGVDVIAHRDPLGVEPPLIKVQVKQMTSTIGAPDVQRLIGTQAVNELSLFVTLGNYSKDAVGIERVRQGLRLINGEELVGQVLANYDNLAPRWRTLIPLTPVLVVGDSA